MRRAALVLLTLALAACSARGPAPVSDRSRPPATAQSDVRKPAAEARTEAVARATPQIAPSTTGVHTVRRGDTLFAIAFANSLDFRQLAEWNALESPDLIRVGQVLRLTPPETAAQTAAVETTPLAPAPLPLAQALPQPAAPAEVPLLREPQAVLLPYSDSNWAQVSGVRVAQAKAVQQPSPASPEPAAAKAPPSPQPAAAATAPPAAVKPPAAAVTTPPVLSEVVENWLWPAEGKLIGRFGAAGGKGIDIAGTRNSPVLAAAPGKVVYSGVGLRGYGRLLIVKHPGEFLSAYAHNEEMLVKEGDTVNAGQKIALMGDSDADRVKLHFEIRQYGKPLDPLKYLPERL